MNNTILENTSIKEAISLIEINSPNGTLFVINHDFKLLGSITDGDIRRMLENEGSDWSTLKAKDIMCDKPKTIEWNELAAKALTIMEDNNISQLIVCKGDLYHGIVHIHDILKEGKSTTTRARRKLSEFWPRLSDRWIWS